MSGKKNGAINGFKPRKLDRTNARLREIIVRERLTRRQVSEMLYKSVTKTGQTPTVAKWLANPASSRNYREMPKSDLELLELKVAMGYHRR